MKVVVAQASLEQQILWEISSEEQRDSSEDVLVLVVEPLEPRRGPQLASTATGTGVFSPSLRVK